MLLLCLCQKRSSRKRNASQCEPTTSIGNNNNLFLHYFFYFFLLEILATFLNRFSASAADYLASSQPPTPQVHFHSSSLSRTTTMPRGQRAAVMLTSGSGQQNQYRTFHATRYVTYLLRTYAIRTLATLQYPSVVWQITTKIHTRNPTLLNTAYSQGEEKDITVVGEPTWKFTLLSDHYFDNHSYVRYIEMYRSQKIHHPCSYEMHVRKKTTFFFKVLFYFSFSLELSSYFSKSGNTRLLLLQFEYCPPDETCTYLTVLFQYFSPKRPSYLLHCIPFFRYEYQCTFLFNFFNVYTYQKLCCNCWILIPNYN